jgi:hypothetical protein
MIPFAPRGFALTTNTRWFLALCVDGSFVARPNGQAIFASTPERLAQLVADKGAGTTRTLPANFAGWVDAAPAPTRAPADFRPFGEAARRHAAANPARTADPDLPRTPGECGATLAMVTRNAERCFLGLEEPGAEGAIGGDFHKAAKAVETAYGKYNESIAFWTVRQGRFRGCGPEPRLVERVEALRVRYEALCNKQVG